MATTSKLSAPTLTSTTGDGIEKNYYGNYGDLQELSGKPEQPWERNATGQYTPLHIGCSSNGKGGNMGMGATAPIAITINQLISVNAIMINFGIDRAITAIAAPEHMQMLTMKLTMATLLLAMLRLPLLVAVKPCFRDYGGISITMNTKRGNIIIIRLPISVNQLDNRCNEEKTVNRRRV